MGNDGVNDVVLPAGVEQRLPHSEWRRPSDG